MSDDWPLTVTERDDVFDSARELTGGDADRICHELDALDDGDGRVAVWLQDWLADEKPLATVENARRVALAWIVRETDKAVGVSQVPPAERGEDADLVFVPKSQARVFEHRAVLEERRGVGHASTSPYTMSAMPAFSAYFRSTSRIFDCMTSTSRSSYPAASSVISKSW